MARLRRTKRRARKRHAVPAPGRVVQTRHVFFSTARSGGLRRRRAPRAAPGDRCGRRGFGAGGGHRDAVRSPSPRHGRWRSRPRADPAGDGRIYARRAGEPAPSPESVRIRERARGPRRWRGRSTGPRRDGQASLRAPRPVSAPARPPGTGRGRDVGPAHGRAQPSGLAPVRRRTRPLAAMTDGRAAPLPAGPRLPRERGPFHGSRAADRPTDRVVDAPRAPARPAMQWPAPEGRGAAGSAPPPPGAAPGKERTTERAPGFSTETCGAAKPGFPCRTGANVIIRFVSRNRNG